MTKTQDTKLPYLKWYPQDLEAEPTLKLCSWEAGFLWVKLIGLMHQSPERGFLLKNNGLPYSEEDLVRVLAGATIERVRTCLFELETHGVFSRDRRKFIYSRKMVAGEKKTRNLKTKNKDNRNENQTKNGHFDDFAPQPSDGNIKEKEAPGVRNVVIPESRVQTPEIRKKDIKKNITKKVSSKSVQKPDGVTTETWDGWVALRKSKKAQITPKVIAIIQTESQKCGYTLEQAMTEMIARNWQGFKAEWILNQPRGTSNDIRPRLTRSEIADRAVAEAVEEFEREQLQNQNSADRIPG